MGRPKRAADGGMVFHASNRANARAQIFYNPEDYAAFESVLGEACERFGMRLLSYCLMPSHWHLALWPKQDGELSRFLGWVTLTHTQRWPAHYHSPEQKRSLVSLITRLHDATWLMPRTKRVCSAGEVFPVLNREVSGADDHL